MVVEPSVAAVLFYGIFRMLPPGALRDEIGFSTFEADPDRAAAFLSATWPYDPQSAAGAEAFAWKRTTINTLLPLATESTRPVSRSRQPWSSGCSIAVARNSTPI